ncbi:fungal-specific transcription factor domain-containing protein [Xylariaceae sp. FL0016]|nr:fungal-specific transcription factor domain-containing protein [Xylariaceae sp. FL0016]
MSDCIDATDIEGPGWGPDDDARESTGRSKKASGLSREDGPACQSCRRKKAKCSRDQPCSHCDKNNLECVYDDRKAKPGIKAGAIDGLSQRVSTLENMFLGQGVLWQQVWRCLDAIGDSSSSDSGCSMGGSAVHSPNNVLLEYTQQLRQTLNGLGVERQNPVPGAISAAARPEKRRRLSNANDSYHSPELPGSLVAEIGAQDRLPPPDLVDGLVEIYFSRVHPWIPMLHVRQFRQRLTCPTQRERLTTVLHAITSLCVRFSTDARLGSIASRQQLARRCRQTVILRSMESFSVENLQALIICAFDTIGGGRGPSSWSIVGSMTRTAEQLQLSVEDEDQPQSVRGARVLIKRMAFLPTCADWIELETRRRVFWNIFLMDRFTSIATGWNLCLTSADVKRRLPCEGALWERGNPLKTPTPYFGVADQPSHPGTSLPHSRSETDDPESIGGFAYCIEATESLSLVTSFFLQQAVDMSKIQDLQVWLMRFKQLDLRLIQWKIYLPEQWQEACALNVDGNMDPNLTLAHITHNTAVVLLHQGIAYPSKEWQSISVRLPAASSAETCLAASSEVAIIADKFLQDTSLLTNPQFAFCLFICGRMFLAHSSYYNVPLSSYFDTIVNNLWEISRRWTGPNFVPAGTDDLASKFASRLTHARQLGPASLDIRQAVYSEDKVLSGKNGGGSQNLNTQPGIVHQTERSVASGPVPMEQEATPDSMTLAFPPLPVSFQVPRGGAGPSGPNTRAVMETSNLYDTVDPNGAIPMIVPYQSGSDVSFDHLNSFLDYSLPPNQRISQFSQPDGKDIC